ncbi:MAG: hypothetical protein AB8H79_07110 [Myxococcota bacterium]
MQEWTVVEPKDQERIWEIAMALLASAQVTTAQEALQRAFAEFYATQTALQRGLKFWVLDENGDEQLRRVRTLENKSWVNERAKPRKSTETPTD